MRKGYAVKVTMYIGTDGIPTRDLSKVKLFSDKDLGQAAADLSNGKLVSAVIRELEEVPAAKQRQMKKKRAKEKTQMKNQSWMRS